MSDTHVRFVYYPNVSNILFVILYLFHLYVHHVLIIGIILPIVDRHFHDNLQHFYLSSQLVLLKTTMAADKTFFDPTSLLAVQCLMRNTINSEGLGGFLGVSQSLKLGAEKRLRYKFHFFLILFFLTWFHNIHVYESSCLCITLSMQYNNEIYKHIKLCQHYGRRNTSPTRNIRFTKACVRILFIACFLSWLYYLLLLSGDIHPKPRFSLPKYCNRK